MNKEIEISAKTIEEAIDKAVAELGAPSRDVIEYSVLEEPKKGFLGLGATPAKIKASYTPSGTIIAFEFLTKLVENMNIGATVSITENTEVDNDSEKIISIDGGGAGVLIGHHGDTLDSLQYLANLAANKKIDGEKREYSKITVDVEGYRRKREETLRSLARRNAEKVLKNKKSVMLEPMNPYERRIIHSEIQNIEGVSTNSIGSENNRKIVIFLEDKASAAKKPPKSQAKKTGNEE